MKHFKKILCLSLCLLMVMSTAFGCKKGLDTETRNLMLAIGALDQNFNPFFSTSLNDSQIAGITQVSLISSDQNGEEACGDDWPTVAQDFKITMKDANGNETSTGSDDGTTEYEFLIKNGMKFSDGKDLTIKDVLFSLYVYLDPAYTGSATIYSTDIVGLKEYRSQDPSGSDSDYEKGFYADAQSRVNKLIQWSIGELDSLDAQSQKDLETVKKLFKEEATSDWSSIETSWAETYKDTHIFTEAWQAYLYAEGIIINQTRQSETGATIEVKIPTDKEDDFGNVIERYVTTLEHPYINGNFDTTQDPVSIEIINAIEAASTSAKVDAYATENGCSKEYAKVQLQRECAIDMVYTNYTEKSNIAYILSGWATAANALEEFAAEAKSKYYNDLRENGVLPVPNISGITHTTTKSFNGKTYKEDHSVLKIVINGIDPKAIWNFAFPVSPMHYYGAYADGTTYTYDGVNFFGVKTGDKEFFSDVLKNTDKNGLPVGGGAYMASSPDGSQTSKSKFFNNNMVFFERNPYFETMGANLKNAKIKKLTYKVMGDDKIIDALITKEIDYGEPNATPSNKNSVSNQKHLTSVDYRTAGYGYVGINPKFVPDVNIRRALMKAMNTNLIISNYYGEDLAEIIYRPMSSTSWAYPDNATEHDNVKYFNENDNEILDLVNAAGYYRVESDGKLHYGGELSGEKLKFTFTIAGESTDHPAYTMFLDAAETLNRLGFEIDVSPDILALKKMNSGDLAVWAAAWSSGIDPDMYQVYHKDSQATSVNNWNYKGILNDTTGDYADELNIVNLLSTKIDEARQTLNQNTRIEKYAECLDLVMQLAVELPTYQRNDLCAYNINVINSKSVNKNANHNMGPFGRIWEIDYK